VANIPRSLGGWGWDRQWGTVEPRWGQGWRDAVYFRIRLAPLARLPPVWTQQCVQIGPEDHASGHLEVTWFCPFLGGGHGQGSLPLHLCVSSFGLLLSTMPQGFSL
jgi:hypothetical protein